MQGIRRASAVSEEYNLSATAQAAALFSANCPVRAMSPSEKALFYASAFLELPPYFFLWMWPSAPSKERFCRDGA